MALRFNPAPGWPTPPDGWFPTADWFPDPSWPPAPEGWSLVELVTEQRTASTPGAGAAQTSEHSNRARGPRLVRSGSVVYDAALLPSGFHERGFSDTDFEYWEDRYYEALSSQDQPSCQALVQGEIDRCGNRAAALSARLERMGREEATRYMPMMRREIEAVRGHMERVIAAAPHHRRT